MKKYLIIGGIIVLALIGIFFALPSSKESNNQPSLTMQTIENDVLAGGQLIDVRTAEEFTTSHINGALNLSLQDIQAGVLPTANKEKPVYVYCHSGNRSGQATVILKNAGFTNIIDLGAMTNVQSLGGIIKS